MILRTPVPAWEQRLIALAEAGQCISEEIGGHARRGTHERALQDAFAACEAITAEHSRSFYLASGLLPREKRRAMRALYAFCRTADNVADCDVASYGAAGYGPAAGSPAGPGPAASDLDSRGPSNCDPIPASLTADAHVQAVPGAPVLGDPVPGGPVPAAPAIIPATGGPGPRHPAERLRELRLGISGRGHHHAGAGDQAHDAILITWAEIQARYGIPTCFAEQLLDGVERDLVQQRYASFEELSVYCYGVASTVGLMSMHITGFSGPQAVPYAIRLGVALQLTNILRDVKEDWDAGRLYLPLDELAAFGLTEADVAAGRVDGRWREFMRFQIARARRLYEEALPGITHLHPDGRFAVSAAALLYRGILDDIEAHGYDVFSRRAYVRKGKKLAALARAWVGAR